MLSHSICDTLFSFATGKLNTARFCESLTALGLCLTGSFQTQLRNGQLTRASLFRVLLRPTLDAAAAARVAGVAVQSDAYSASSALGGSLPTPSSAADSSNANGNEGGYWHAQMYAHSSGNGNVVDAAGRHGDDDDDSNHSLAGSEFDQYPGGGADLPPQVHEALKVFCEEQVDGARLRRYLHTECGMALSDEQVHVITRQEVSGRRNLRALLMVFAPQRLKRDGFKRIDSAPAHERIRAAAAERERQASPPPAGQPTIPHVSFAGIQHLAQIGTCPDMLQFDAARAGDAERRQLRAVGQPPRSQPDLLGWSDLDPHAHVAPTVGVRTAFSAQSASHHGDIFAWQGANTVVPPERRPGKLVLAGAVTSGNVEFGSLAPRASLDLRQEFGIKGQADASVRGTREGQESAQDLVTRNSYPTPRPASASASQQQQQQQQQQHSSFAGAEAALPPRSHLEPTPAEWKRNRNTGTKQVAEFPSTAKNFPLGGSAAVAPASARSAPFGTDANVESPAFRNIPRTRAGEMTPTRIYEALSTNLRRMPL